MRVTSGEPYVEKKSTFQVRRGLNPKPASRLGTPVCCRGDAHVAPVDSFEEVAAVMDALLSISKIRAATHNIMAYRIHSLGASGCGGTFLQVDGRSGGCRTAALGNSRG
ncbi:hypothetical protein Vretimale_18701 [Volvox reticuliferus]|nr:hypothetical protein Vretimale_18701 [Volvox reticuliferus]